jgi:hypothetical protein
MGCIILHLRENVVTYRLRRRQIQYSYLATFSCLSARTFCYHDCSCRRYIRTSRHLTWLWRHTGASQSQIWDFNVPKNVGPTHNVSRLNCTVLCMSKQMSRDVIKQKCIICLRRLTSHRRTGLHYVRCWTMGRYRLQISSIFTECKPTTDPSTSASCSLPLVNPPRPTVARFLYLHQQVAADITEAPPVATWNEGADYSNRIQKNPAEFHDITKTIGVLWGHSQHLRPKFISTFRITQLIRIQYTLYVPCNLFRSILWPSSSSCSRRRERITGRCPSFTSSVYHNHYYKLLF